MKGERAVREAAKAHTRLNAFYAVIAILEGGCLPGGSESASRTAQKIIGLCKQEGGRQLRLYDKAVAACSRPLPEDTGRE